jgi:hypothetical protein
MRALDSAVTKGVLHPNNAARRKSRLILKYNAAVASLQSPPVEAPKPKKKAPSKKSEPKNKAPRKRASKK